MWCQLCGRDLATFVRPFRNCAIATLALAIAAVLTAAVAIVTLATEASNRAIKVTALGAIVAIVVITLQRADLRINFTGSMPIGVYVLSPLVGDVKRGMLVAACAPTGSAEIGERRAYLAAGPCPGDTELLLKFVGAISGDEVAAGVLVNGHLLPHSRPVPRDRAGRELAAWPVRRYRLSPGRMWLYGANDRSWDSRYWGPVFADAIVSEAVPLFAAPRLVSETSWTASHDMRRDPP